MLVLVKCNALFHKTNASAVGISARYKIPNVSVKVIKQLKPKKGIKVIKKTNPNKLNKNIDISALTFLNLIKTENNPQLREANKVTIKPVLISNLINIPFDARI